MLHVVIVREKGSSAQNKDQQNEVQLMGRMRAISNDDQNDRSVVALFPSNKAHF